MRWILVFIFLYLIPLLILFKNNKNFKRNCIYGSIYTVLATTIVISNVYMSGLKKIEEALYYQNYAFDQRYKDKYTSNFEYWDNKKSNKSKDKDISKESEVNKEDVYEERTSKDNSDISKNDSNGEEINSEVDKEVNKEIESKKVKESDLEKLDEFKRDIYDIERVALIPMRDCLPYTKDIAKNLNKISEIRESISYAEEMCKDVIGIYESMEMPDLSKEEYVVVLSNARDDVKKAYELREKAMENAIKLLDTKNPKYIGKITEYLKLSDNYIASFKERVQDLGTKINKN